jgi:transcriptional regulator with XRE-family HTH domain
LSNFVLNSNKKSAAFWQEFGQFIQSQRLALGYTELVVSSYLECSDDVLRSYEAGEQSIPLNKIYALANCLNIEPNLITTKLGAAGLIKQ